MDRRSWAENHGQEIMDMKTEAKKADSVESTHPDHEGGSRNVEQSTQAQPEENSVAHDQDEMPSESDAETQVEAPSEGNEAEPEQIQPLIRRDHGQEIMDRKSWTEKLKQRKV
ncbi:hypothetical protein DY000_02005438 [Brassica cretica]|uniref:Uncharacterized protein n=1 Tax=Brassica cretica TaxID=69181 RepID=A0ABQ7CFG2_BRACR|nr:hypothetical protein DY000_02005438 [Brassica cretica]